jgi:putative membrane-bound dehydrogenase-like protein
MAALSAAWLLSAGPAGAGKIPPATDAPKPLTPEESRRRFQLPPGFRVELVGAEPQLAEPNGMAFDARGRLYVCELHGYNRDGYYDILELNKTGVLDTEVRRIPASKKAQELADKETYSTIKLLEDTDGDGRMDRVTVFADRLPPCYGLVAARDGVIALCVPDILYLADTKGDGKANVRETLFTGFGVGEIWTRISNPRWGIDNWIYAASGASSAGTIRGPHLPAPVRLGNTGFRFKADGSRLEPVSGGTSGYGLAQDNWGDRLLCTNQQHALFVAPLPYQALARNPYSPSLDPVVNICAYGHPAKLFPTSKPDPWRLKRGQQAEWVKFYGAAETTAGLFTSACAPVIYQADLFPEPYRGQHFSCEPAQNLVHRCVLEPKGAGLVARRAEEGKEFLTSTDQWFRPVNLHVGPEGALYVVDMYREIIEDYSAIPRYLQQQYVEGLKNGYDKGRIWRIVPDKKVPRSPNLARASGAELVTELASANVWRRQTAQRLLVERGDVSVAPRLADLAVKGAAPQARLHALYTLAGLSRLQPSLIERALGDEHYGVRREALVLAEPMLDKEPALLTKALALVTDPHAKVRLQLAFSLGESRDARVLQVLAALARGEGADPWMRVALLSAVPDRAGRLAALLVEPGDRDPVPPLLRPLAAVVGARNQGAEVADLLRLVAGLKHERAAAVQEQVLTGLAEGLGRAAVKKPVATAGQQALEQLLQSASGTVKKQALHVAGLLKLKEARVLREARAAALKTALDSDRSLPERLEAVGLLTEVPAAELTSLRALLGARQPIELQLATVKVLAAADGEESAPLLFGGWAGYSPRMQAAVIDALCGRQDRLPALLDAIDKRVVEPSSLPPLRQAQLLENPNAAIRARAKKLLASRASSDDRQQVLKRYQPALKLPRDSKRGKVVFEQQCMKCHQLKGQGFAVGPDLAALQNRPDESLLVDILDPSSTITVGYRTYTVISKAGKVYTGTLAAETATSVTLRREQGAEDVILRKDIDEMVASAKSLMPEGIEKEISPQDMAHLIGYLREVLNGGPKRDGKK